MPNEIETSPAPARRSGEPLQVALVGYGFAGKTFHAPLISACQDLVLSSVVTRQADVLKADWPDARAAVDLETVLADPAIDLVVIATPNDLHAPQAEAALKAGKAVVIDKPFALSVAEARSLIATATDHGVLLSVFHNRRWDADFLALKDAISAGELGDVITFESHFDRFRPEVRDRWREGDGPGAGIWFDLGPHLIDQALVLFGRPIAITCDLAVMRPGGRACDWAHAVLRYEGLRVVLHADMTTAAADIRFAVHGTRASWLKSGLDVQEDQLKAGHVVGGAGWGVDPHAAVVVDGASGLGTPRFGPPGDYPAYYAAIAAALKSGPNPVPAEQALAVMEIIEAGVESSDRRVEVEIPAAS